MLIQKAFKFEIIPNGEQIRKIKRFCGCARFVFNRALAWQNEQYKQDNSFKFSYNKIAIQLPVWKKELVWLKDCYSQVLQQSLKDLESAFKHFFRRQKAQKKQKQQNEKSGLGFPKFKKKGVKDSFRFPQGYKLEQHNNRLYLPKIGWVRYRNSRQVVGEIKNVTVSQKCGRFFVSIQTEFEQKVLTSTLISHKNFKDNEIGLDLGVARFVTLSNGGFFAPLNAFKTYKGKLAKLQKQLKNKVKFSKNWRKLNAKIAKLYHKIANCRKDYLHKVSSKISKNHTFIYAEALQIENMTKSAKGTIEQPGKQVKQKSGLNRAILDQSWGEFLRQLDYKTRWQQHGGMLILVPPQHTSQTCPCCGHVAKENRQTQATFKCIECDYTENADVVGAMNILERGRIIAQSLNKNKNKD